MAEYVLKENILKYLEKKSSIEISTNSVIGKDISRAIDVLYCDIDNMPAADVQPVDRWISVRDRLPETNAIGVAHILVYDKLHGVVKADFLDESANYHYGSNIFIISNTSARLHRVTHWQPLPEPPKSRNKESQEEDNHAE